MAPSIETLQKILKHFSQAIGEHYLLWVGELQTIIQSARISTLPGLLPTVQITSSYQGLRFLFVYDGRTGAPKSIARKSASNPWESLWSSSRK